MRRCSSAVPDSFRTRQEIYIAEFSFISMASADIFGLTGAGSSAQIAAAVQKDLGARGVLVIIEAQQLCMTMRGDLAHGTRTVTSECNGVFKEDTALYQQAWMILGGEKA